MTQTMNVSAELMAAMHSAVRRIKELLAQGKRRTSADFVCEVIEDISIDGRTPVHAIPAELQATLRSARVDRDSWRPTSDDPDDLTYNLEKLLKLLEKVA